MKIELLNVRIEIQKSTVVTDAVGNHKNEWVPYYSCFATVSAESPKEDSAAGTIVDNSKVDFTVRYCRDSAAVTSTGYRIVFKNEMYNILGVDNKKKKNKAVKFLCQKVSR